MSHLKIFCLMLIASLFYSSCEDDNPNNVKIPNPKNDTLILSSYFGSPGTELKLTINRVVGTETPAEVYFNNIKVEIKSRGMIQSNSYFAITIPSTLDKISTVSLVLPDGKDTCKNEFIIFDSKKLRINNFYPGTVVKGGSIIIEGSNFHPSKSGNYLYLGNARLMIESVIISKQTELIKALIPDTAKSNYLTIKVNNDSVISSKVLMIKDSIDNNTSSVLLYDFEPKSGMPGSEVTIYGTNFHPDLNKNEIFLNDKKLVNVSILNTDYLDAIIVEIPSDAQTGKFKIKINQSIDETIQQYNIIATATDLEIIDFEPKFGIQDSDVKIKGTNFGNNRQNIKVYFGSIEAPITFLSDTLIWCRVPCGAEKGKIKISKNMNDYYSSTSFDPFTFYSIAIEIDNVEAHYTGTNATDLFFMPRTEFIQSSKDDLKNSKFVFHRYYANIDFKNNLILNLLFSEYYTNIIKGKTYSYSYSATFDLLPFYYDDNGDIIVRVTGNNLENYNINFKYECNSYYLVGGYPDDFITESKLNQPVKYNDKSSLKITLKKCK